MENQEEVKANSRPALATNAAEEESLRRALGVYVNYEVLTLLLLTSLQNIVLKDIANREKIFEGIGEKHQSLLSFDYRDRIKELKEAAKLNQAFFGQCAAPHK